MGIIRGRAKLAKGSNPSGGDAYSGGCNEGINWWIE